MVTDKAPNNCPACGSYKYWGYIGEAKEGISGGKVVAGGVGMVAGAASGKKVHQYHCAKCGLSTTYKETSDRTRNPNQYTYFVTMESQLESSVQESKASVTIIPVIVSEDNINAILMRIELFLEDGEWDRADAYCEQVLNYNPQCVQAYVGKLMAELKVKKESDLIQVDSFENNLNYQKALRFAKADEREKLQNYIVEINARKEKDNKDSIYKSAKSNMDGTLEGYSMALASFYSIKGWKDSDDLAEKCKECIRQIKEEQERERRIAEELQQEKAREKEKYRKRLKKCAIKVALIISFCIVIIMFGVIPKKSSHNTSSSSASTSATESKSDSIEQETMKDNVSGNEPEGLLKVDTNNDSSEENSSTSMLEDMLETMKENVSDNESEKLAKPDTNNDSPEEKNSTPMLEETKKGRKPSLEDVPVGIKFYREITEDYIYKQKVEINEDGTISISETLYSKDRNDKFEGGRITGIFHLTDEEAIWNPDDNSFTVEQDLRSDTSSNATHYKNYYKISLYGDDVIYLECYSTSENRNESLQRLNGEYKIEE